LIQARDMHFGGIAMIGGIFTSPWATAVYIAGGFLVVVGALEKLFGWLSWLRSRVAEPLLQEREREHDQRVFDRIRDVLSRELVQTFLRDHDFGGGWRKEWMWSLSELARLNNVEDQFLDAELERLRSELMTANETIRRHFAQESWPEDGNREWQFVGVRPRGPDDEDTKLWLRRQKMFNEAASDVAEAYDALIDAARRKALVV
jgi:hypothetical protein